MTKTSVSLYICLVYTVINNIENSYEYSISSSGKPVAFISTMHSLKTSRSNFATSIFRPESTRWSCVSMTIGPNRALLWDGMGLCLKYSRHTNSRTPHLKTPYHFGIKLTKLLLSTLITGWLEQKEYMYDNYFTHC